MHRAEGYQVLVCNPNQEAWEWKHVKAGARRTATTHSSWPNWPRLEQLVSVYIPYRRSCA